MKRCRPPSSDMTFFVIPGYRDSRSSRTSASVAPSAPTLASPPACLRRIIGSFTVTVIVVRCSSLGPRGDAAELLVVDQLGDRRLLAAHRAVGVPADLHLLELHRQRVVEQQPALERLALAGQQLDR